MSKELAKTYDPKGLEDRLYQKWLDKGYFHAKVNPDKKPFTIVMPPPNVTGQLHMGHALDNTMQDILIRFRSCILYTSTPEDFFCSNNYYTTAANRISRQQYDNAVTCEDVIELCRQNGRLADAQKMEGNTL